jgi:hypothetical protein
VKVGSSISLAARNAFRGSRGGREVEGGEPLGDNRQSDMIRPQNNRDLNQQRRSELAASSRSNHGDNRLRDVTRQRALDAQRKEMVEDMNRVQDCLQRNRDPEDTKEALSTLHRNESEKLVVSHEVEREIHGNHPRLVKKQQETVALMTARQRRQTAFLDMELRLPDRYSEVSGPPPSYHSVRRPSDQGSLYSDQRLSGPPDESAE